MPDVHSLPLNAFYECKRCRCAARQHSQYEREGGRMPPMWECRTCRAKHRRFARGTPPPECIQIGTFAELFVHAQWRVDWYNERHPGRKVV